jgi:hypothetical protein
MTFQTVITTDTTTTANFNELLKRYMPYSLLMEEAIKRDYFFQKVEKDNNWKGGNMDVPFKGAKSSSYRFGALVNEAAITKTKYAIGEVSGYKELWGAMVFEDADLNKHDNLEQSFIKIIPDQIEEFIDGMKEKVSGALMNGANFATVTSAGTALGVVGVDRPERFEIGMYVDFGVVGTVNQSGWVALINMSTSELTIVTAMSDVDAVTNKVDLTATAGPLDAVIVGNGVFIQGAITSGKSFTSLSSQLLSLANGGTANLFGISKLKFPFMQAANFDGAAIDKTNILAKIFDFYNETRRIGKGAPTEILMSFKNLASCMALLEASRDYLAKDSKASVYGWTEIEVVGVKGKLTLVGINELDDDKMYILDWRGIKLHTNGMFERRKSPSGNEYYEVRAESGFKYIVDIRFFGELIVSRPSYQGIIYNVAY